MFKYFCYTLLKYYVKTLLCLRTIVIVNVLFYCFENIKYIYSILYIYLLKYCESKV